MDINLKKMMDEIDGMDEISKLNDKLTNGQQRFLNIIVPLAAMVALQEGLSCSEAMEALYGIGLVAKEKLDSYK